MKTEWLQKRIQYIKGLKKPSEQQQLIVSLYGLENRTPEQERKLAALAKAERAAEKALAAKSVVTKMLTDEKRKAAEAERKARNHQLFESAGLLSLAGLLDKATGKPVVDRGALLGALAMIAKTPQQDPRWSAWKTQGDALLAQGEKS